MLAGNTKTFQGMPASRPKASPSRARAEAAAGPASSHTAAGCASLPESPWRGQREHSERARQAKRESVLQAAARAFAARGVQGTSMDDIAAELSVTKPTIYRAVGDKEALIQACEERMNARFLNAMREAQAAGGTGLQKALRYQWLSLQLIDGDDFGRLVLVLGANRDLFSAVSEPTRAMREQVQAHVRRWIEDDRQAGLVRAEVDPRMATLALFATFNFIPRWYRREGADPLERVFEQHRRLFVWALSDQPALHGLPD
jgi:AcrR family transcriptional regulator